MSPLIIFIILLFLFTLLVVIRSISNKKESEFADYLIYSRVLYKEIEANPYNPQNKKLKRLREVLDISKSDIQVLELVNETMAQQLLKKNLDSFIKQKKSQQVKKTQKENVSDTPKKAPSAQQQRTTTSEEDDALERLSVISKKIKEKKDRYEQMVLEHGEELKSFMNKAEKRSKSL